MEIAVIFIILILFLGAMFEYGYRKGLIRIVLSVAITVAAFVLSVLLAAPFESFIRNNTKIYERINKQMEEYVEEYIPAELDIASEEIQKEAIDGLKIPEAIKDKLVKDNTADKMLNMGADSFSEYVAMSLTDILVEAFSVAVLFIIIGIILRIVVSILDLLSRLPIINGLNKSLGGLAGLAEGIVVVWFACIVITALGGTDFGSRILEIVCSNKILAFIYDNNILMNFMKTLK